MEMLDEKGSMYSDRPVFPIAELVGVKDAVPLLPYDDRLRWHCKNFHRIIGTRTSMEVYRPMEGVESYRFLKRVLAKPEELMKHVRQYGHSSSHSGVALNML